MDTKIPATFWRNETIEELDAEAKLAILWLHTAHVSHCGWVSATTRRFVFDTSCQPEALQRATQALGKGLVSHPKGFWLRDYIRQQIGDGQRLKSNNMHKSVLKELSKLPEEISEAILSEYPILQGLAEPSPSTTQALPKGLGSTREERRGEAKRGEERLGESRGDLSDTSNPPIPDRKDVPEKKESRPLSDPPDLATYLSLAIAYSKGNSAGLTLPEAFVRHWHDLRTAMSWCRSGSETPIANTPEARFADLKNLATSYRMSGQLSHFMPGQKKETAAAQSIIQPCPAGDYIPFAREMIGWDIDPETARPWESLSDTLRKEWLRHWDCEQRKHTSTLAA